MAQPEETGDAHSSAGSASKPTSRASAAEQATKKKLNKEDDEGEAEGDNGDEEEEDEEEEEYEIEAIIDVKRSYFKKGENAYLVKWKGYSEEHNSWVSEEDASNAKELITEFLQQRAKAKELSAKQSARGRKPNSAKTSKGAKDVTPDTESISVSTSKRGRGKATSPSDSEEEPPTTKKSRANANSNGSASAKRGALAALDREDDDDVPMVDASAMIHDGRSYTSMKALKLAARKSWGDLVKEIATVEHSPQGLIVYFETTSGKYVREPASVCREKFPQKLFDFYESHLKWRAADQYEYSD